jgi:hypothetical protein
MSTATPPSPPPAHLVPPCPILEALVAAYNAGDARAFADLFAEDAVHGDLHGEPPLRGRAAIYRRYVQVFETFPHNRTEVLYRVMLPSFVIDHERVRRFAQAQPFDVVAIYRLAGELVARLDLVRG